MKRDYKDGVKDDITYFTGVEVEDTPALFNLQLKRMRFM